MNAGGAARARRLRFFAAVPLPGPGVLLCRHASLHDEAAVAPGTPPLTGRQIAGIATDTNWLDRVAREREEAPEQALQLVGIQPGMVVADVGAGTGYMTTRLARLVGPTGKVYANDVQPAMLQIIENKARIEHLANVEVVQGTDTDARLPDNVIDLALLVDVYHEFWHPQEMLRSIRRSLKSNGELVLVEYRKEDPSIPIADTHRMSVADSRPMSSTVSSKRIFGCMVSNRRGARRNGFSCA